MLLIQKYADSRYASDIPYFGLAMLWNLEDAISNLDPNYVREHDEPCKNKELPWTCNDCKIARDLLRRHLEDNAE